MRWIFTPAHSYSDNATFGSVACYAHFQRVLVCSNRIHAVFPQTPDESGHYEKRNAVLPLASKRAHPRALMKILHWLAVPLFTSSSAGAKRDDL